MNLPIFRPILPRAEKIYPYLEQIDINRYYSNMGPLSKEFEKRLANHFRVEQSRIALSANGTLAIYQTLKALDIPKDTICVIPSWTFIATAAAVVLAGLKPFFIDVNRKDWVIYPEEVEQLMKDYEIGSVIVVSPFGNSLEFDAWEKFQAKTGVPVVFDAAAGFDSFSRNDLARQTSIPFIVSLHATKVFGIGEGAVTVANDSLLAEKITQMGNFGFQGSREAKILGVNSKMSEYSCAVGLANFDCWADTRDKWSKLMKNYINLFTGYPEIILSPGYGGDWVSSCCQIVVPEDKVELIKKKFQEKNIQTLSWWGKGCHAHKAYEGFKSLELPNTNYLAKNSFAIPFWLEIPEVDISRIFSCFE